MKNLLLVMIALSTFFSLPVFAEIVIEVDIPEDNNKNGENGDNNVQTSTDIKPDIVLFKNKDKMHGRMVSIIADKGLLWNPDIIGMEFNVPLCDTGFPLSRERREMRENALFFGLISGIISGIICYL